MIIFDPTEVMPQSRVYVELTSIGSVCEGLEALTGADMLISPLDKPNLTTVNSKLGQTVMQKHLDAGAILVQRKSGGDVINFIKDHDQILGKMLQFTAQPWLLTIGSFHYDVDGKLCCNRARLGGKEGWSYWSYWGALRSWQVRGGYIDNVPDDADIVGWYEHTLKALNDKETQHYAAPRKPSQQLVVDSDDGDGEAYIRNASIMALATIDSVGVSKAVAITDYAGNLGQALVYLSDIRNIGLQNSPKGIGSKIHANTRLWLGLRQGGEGEDQWYETMAIDTVYPFRKEVSSG